MTLSADNPLRSLGVDALAPPLGWELWWLLAVALGASWLWVTKRDAMGLAVTQRWVLAGLRGAAMAMLLFLLAGPSVLRELPPAATRPPLLVLLDHSASMTTRDVPGTTIDEQGAPLPGDLSRFEAMRRRWLEPALLQSFARTHQPRVIRFDRDTSPVETSDLGVSPDEPGQQTRLFDAVREAALNHPAQQGDVLLLSDGHDTDRSKDDALAAALKRRGWRIFAVAVGEPDSRPDVRVHAYAETDRLLRGQRTTLHATLLQRGYEGRPATVELYHEQRMIERRSVTLGRSRTPLRFTIDPQRQAPPNETAGSNGDRRARLHGYRVAVRPIEGEASTDNNQRWVLIREVRERIRVAFFEGEPSWDSRFLARVLREDPQVSLDAWYAIGPNRVLHQYTDQGEPSPGESGLRPVSATDSLGRGTERFARGQLSQRQLNHFDVVILGRGMERFFPGVSATHLVDYATQRGGAVILARGRAYANDAAAAEAIARLEPVTWSDEQVRGLRLQLTEAGKASPLIGRATAPPNNDAVNPDAPADNPPIAKLPDMLAATRIEKEKALSVVLLRQKPVKSDTDSGNGGPGFAAMAHHRVGAGRVLAVLTDGLWRWAFLRDHEAASRDGDSALPAKPNAGADNGELAGVYQRFWSRALRWLVGEAEFLPGQSISLQPQRLSTPPGKAITLEVATRYAPTGPMEATLTATAPDGQVTPLQLSAAPQAENRWVATFTPSQQGVHRLQLSTTGMPTDVAMGEQSVRIAVQEESIETLDTSAKPATLNALCQATDGQCVTMSQTDVILDRLRERSATQQQAQQRLEYHYQRPWVIGGLFASLALAWGLGRRWGLA